MQYLDGKTTVTHIIASNPTPKKKIEFRRYRIVKPAWVVDSVKAGRLQHGMHTGLWMKVLASRSLAWMMERSSVRPIVSKEVRDQTDNSWYTSQVKRVVQELSIGEQEDSKRNTPRSIASVQGLVASGDDERLVKPPFLRQSI
jgi:DNA repair protein REV1